MGIRGILQGWIQMGVDKDTLIILIVVVVVIFVFSVINMVKG